jgi:hypothetical protein
MRQADYRSSALHVRLPVDSLDPEGEGRPANSGPRGDIDSALEREETRRRQETIKEVEIGSCNNSGRESTQSSDLEPSTNRLQRRQLLDLRNYDFTL